MNTLQSDIQELANYEEEKPPDTTELEQNKEKLEEELNSWDVTANKAKENSEVIRAKSVPLEKKTTRPKIRL